MCCNTLAQTDTHTNIPPAPRLLMRGYPCFRFAGRGARYAECVVSARLTHTCTHTQAGDTAHEERTCCLLLCEKPNRGSTMQFLSASLPLFTCLLVRLIWTRMFILHPLSCLPLFLLASITAAHPSAFLLSVCPYQNFFPRHLVCPSVSLTEGILLPAPT